MNHIIKKQVFDLLLDSEKEAFYLQHKVSNYNQQKILSVLQKVFDELCPNDNSFYIDHLEIDLGKIPITKIKTDQWAEVFEEQLREQLKDLSISEDSQIIVSTPNPNSVFKQWLFTMQNGYLPWNVSAISDQWYQKVLESIASNHQVAQEFRTAAKNNSRVIERIVFQHPVPFLISLLESLTAEKQHTLGELTAEFFVITEYFLKKLDKQIFLSKRKTEVEIWKEVFSFVLLLSENSSVRISSGFIIEQLISVFFVPEQTKEIVKTKWLNSYLPITLPFFEKISDSNKKKPGINKESDRQQSEMNNKNILLPDSSFDKLFSVTSEKEERFFSAEDTDIFKSNRNEKDITDIIREEIFIKNAGVVLLHPFLHSFFKTLGYINEKKFINAELHQKALHLIYFLATGDEHAMEHDLLISKILCAFPLDEPVDYIVQFANEEKTEAENLLMATVANWDILKSTSVEGLRESFLQRPGKLYVENNEPHLHIESNSIDVLLDHLPWNLSIIKLPWMENILRIQWR